MAIDVCNTRKNLSTYKVACRLCSINNTRRVSFGSIYELSSQAVQDLTIDVFACLNCKKYVSERVRMNEKIK